jgi:hypothetical protein
MPELVAQAKSRLTDPERRDAVRVTYYVHGGSPGERLEERVELAGSGDVRVDVRDDLNPDRAGEASGSVDTEELARILDALAEADEELVTREEASFPPDSLVGWVEIEVGGETETYYFDADAVYARLSKAPEERAPDEAETPMETVTYRADRIRTRLLGGGHARS